jgi:four helix bundle protein
VSRDAEFPKIENLRVFRLAYEISLGVHQASLEWPKVEQYGGIADQLRRSSKPICANLMEGAGRRSESPREFTRFVGIAIGSANECRLWCHYAEDLGYVSSEQSQAWRATFTEVAKMLTGLRSRYSSPTNNDLPSC